MTGLKDKTVTELYDINSVGGADPGVTMGISGMYCEQVSPSVYFAMVATTTRQNIDSKSLHSPSALAFGTTTPGAPHHGCRLTSGLTPSSNGRYYQFLGGLTLSGLFGPGTAVNIVDLPGNIGYSELHFFQKVKPKPKPNNTPEPITSPACIPPPLPLPPPWLQAHVLTPLSFLPSFAARCWPDERGDPLLCLDGGSWSLLRRFQL